MLPRPIYGVWRRARIFLAETSAAARRRPALEEQMRSALRQSGLLVVLAGPFAGMAYAEGSAGSELVPKLLGTYEEELHSSIEDSISAGYEVVLNVGCGEGYYAVGMARRMPEVHVIAYDIDPEARRLCGEMARLNSVADRVAVAGECTWSDLRDQLADRRALIIMDCEGCEATLLDPVKLADLREAAVIVELHEFAVPGVGRTVPDRFASSHSVQLFDARRRPPTTHPAIVGLGREATRVAVDERRPPGMQWAVMVPVTSRQAD